MSIRDHIRRLEERRAAGWEVAEGSAAWMNYITSEVRATCAETGLSHQVRRKWSVRHKPVRESLVDDYEWKLILRTYGSREEARTDEFEEGTYYVLGFDPQNGRFLLQHDTNHCGATGPWRERASYTEILLGADGQDHDERLMVTPPNGWLREHLTQLLSQFGPNQFSLT